MEKEIKIAAGILLYRIRDNKPEVLVLHTGGPYYAKKDECAWSIPKGETDGAEDLFEVAKREFKEETGFDAPEGNYIDIGVVKRPGKTVHIWAIEGEIDTTKIESNTCMIEWPPRSGKQIEIPEMDRGEFVDLETARKKLYAYLVPIIDEFEKKI